ncbi:hypothetical protein HY285_04920 [Candidatus Peregrinibacteria bacterium]|nr:hypothetical protein [Candidatus Peregrinibacteria bacterium]MBI3816853.1 hypothetical protein [Candidatus Peregrinibacteria bacterium]
MPRLRPVLLSLTLLFLVIEWSVGVRATATGSGTETNKMMTNTGALLLQWQSRVARTKDFWNRVLDAQAREQRKRGAVARYDKKRAEFRAQCRDEIRRANRDTKFPTIQRCFRGEITQERALLLAQTGYLHDAPGIPSDVRQALGKKIGALTDALGTVVSAVDAGVYTGRDDLLEARNNLRDRYRNIVWEGWTQLRIERLITWVDYLLLEARDQAAAAGDPSPWNTATQCLLSAETSLYDVRARVIAGTGGSFPSLAPSLHTCASLMKFAAMPMTASGAMMSSSSSQ